MAFRQLSMLAAVITFGLMAVLMLVPGVLFWLFQIESNASVEVFARRASMLFLFASAITFLFRDLAPGRHQRDIAIAVSMMMGGLAIVGFVEFLLGRVGPGIFLAIATEIGFIALFVPYVRQKV